jgi:hypothetical protein
MTGKGRSRRKKRPGDKGESSSAMPPSGGSTGQECSTGISTPGMDTTKQVDYLCEGAIDAV